MGAPCRPQRSEDGERERRADVATALAVTPEEKMPLVKIEMLKGKSPEYKKAVFDCVHRGLIQAFGIEDWDRFQRITEYDKSCWEVPEGKTENFMIIEMTVFPGRTKEQKKAAIEIITSLLGEKLGIAATDVFIVMNEPPLENWGMGGKQKN